MGIYIRGSFNKYTHEIKLMECEFDKYFLSGRSNAQLEFNLIKRSANESI